MADKSPGAVQKALGLFINAPIRKQAGEVKFVLKTLSVAETDKPLICAPAFIFVPEHSFAFDINKDDRSADPPRDDFPF